MTGEIVDTESRVWTTVLAERDGGPIGTGMRIPEREGVRTRVTKFYVAGEGSDPRELAEWIERYGDYGSPPGDRGKAAAERLARHFELELGEHGARPEVGGDRAVSVASCAGFACGNGYVVTVRTPAE